MKSSFSFITAVKKCAMSMVLVALLCTSVQPAQAQSPAELQSLINALLAQIAGLQEQLAAKTNPEVVKVGGRVETLDNLSIRNTPSGTRIGVAYAGEEGTVIDGPSSLDGRTWWKVDYEKGPSGWSAGEWLEVVSTIPNQESGIRVTNIEPRSGYVIDPESNFFINFDLDGIGPKENDKDYLVCLRLIGEGVQENIQLNSNDPWCTPAFDATYVTSYDDHAKNLEEGEYQVYVLVLGPEDPSGKDRGSIYKKTGSTFLVSSEDPDEDTLAISSSGNDPDPTTLILDENDESDWLKVFAFLLDARNGRSDIVVEEIVIDIDTSVDELEDIIYDAELRVGGEYYDDYQIQNGDQMWFDIDGDLVIDAEDAEEVELFLRFEEATAEHNGATIQASVARVTGEGEYGNVVASGSVDGETHTMLSEAGSLLVELVSADEEVIEGGGAEFQLTFDVTAIGDDMYVPMVTETAKRASPYVNIYNIVEKSTGSTAGNRSVVLRSTADEEGNYFLVKEAESERFTLTAIYEPENSGVYRMYLETLGYSESASNDDMDRRYLDDGDFTTDYIAITGTKVTTPEPEPEATAPEKNVFSCDRNSSEALGAGELACYGMWDYGQSFGGDKHMCGAYGMGKTAGCEIEVKACASGMAEATKYYSNRDLRSLSNSRTDSIAERLDTTREIVRSEVAGLWEYECVASAADEVSLTFNFESAVGSEGEAVAKRVYLINPMAELPADANDNNLFTEYRSGKEIVITDDGMFEESDISDYSKITNIGDIPGIILLLDGDGVTVAHAGFNESTSQKKTLSGTIKISGGVIRDLSAAGYESFPDSEEVRRVDDQTIYFNTEVNTGGDAFRFSIEKQQVLGVSQSSMSAQLQDIQAALAALQALMK